ncbi:hydrolase [Leuconostoc phage CHB]|jgi:phosphoribosyl 1,2-cyclic phosphodiesterase|uniref:Hydrolase n=1 Tax=Leuconostoc phage CHB TaxID=1897737 RepID=A0A219VHK4_9CAUD|nr:hydrolase [Leuconostoc phage CHB]
MKLNVLATGSSGNASIVTGENETIALDFGLSFKKWHTLLENGGLGMPDELFITHSHG